MKFNKKKKQKMFLSRNSVKYLTQVDILLQAVSLTDGHFLDGLGFVRGKFPDVIDDAVRNFSEDDKVNFMKELKKYELLNLAAMSRVLKTDVFDDYLDKIYNKEERDIIRHEIKNIPSRIPFSPIRNRGDNLNN